MFIPQGAAADRFLDNLSGFINGLDTKNNVKVSQPGPAGEVHNRWIFWKDLGDLEEGDEQEPVLTCS